MRRLVLASASPIETECGDDVDRKVPHFPLGECLPQAAIVDLRPLLDGLDQRDLSRSQPAENGLDFHRLHDGLEIVEQRVVRMIRRREECDVFPLQIDDLLEMRSKNGKVGSGARFPPGVVGRRRDLGLAGHEIRGDAARLGVVARRDRDCAGGRRIGIRSVQGRDGVVEQTADLVGREFFVLEPAHGREHFAMNGSAAGRHIDPFVPLEQRRGVPQVGDLANAPERRAADALLFRRRTGHTVRAVGRTEQPALPPKFKT